MNERYLDFLKFALQRIIDTALFYETEAKMASDPSRRLFLYYLAGKKRVQHVVLEMSASGSHKSKPSSTDNNWFTINNKGHETVMLREASSETIRNYARSRAQKDANIFSSLAALEEDTQTKRLLQTLSKISKEFLRDIDDGFQRFCRHSNMNTIGVGSGSSRFFSVSLQNACLSTK